MAKYIQSGTGAQLTEDQIRSGQFSAGTYFIESGTGRRVSPQDFQQSSAPTGGAGTVLPTTNQPTTQTAPTNDAAARAAERARQEAARIERARVAKVNQQTDIIRRMISNGASNALIESQKSFLTDDIRDDVLRAIPGLGSNTQKLATQTGALPSVVGAPTTQTATPNLPVQNAPSIQQAFQNSLAKQVEVDRTRFETALATQKEDIDKRATEAQKNIDELEILQAEGIADVGKLMEPFREKLEAAERERLQVNKNFQENQKLVDELGSLLTEGNEIIAGQKAMTGLSSIRNPRINKTIEDINSRVGVIQAVINARNGQIEQAFNMIDRSIDAINADRQDQLVYYEALLNFYEGQKDVEGNKLITLESEKKQILEAEIALIESDLARSQENAEYIKGLMQDPDSASFMASAGVTLNDTPEEVNRKIAQQSAIQEVADFKNELTAEGYTFVPFPKGGEQTFEVGGKQLAFKAPVDAPGSPTNSDKPLSVNQIEQFRRAYDWTPPPGFTWNELVQYMADSPGATPEELEEGARRQLLENQQLEGAPIKPNTQSPLLGTQQFGSASDAIDDIVASLTGEQLNTLISKAKASGTTSLFRVGKKREVKAYLESIEDIIQQALEEGSTTQEIIEALTS